MARHAHFARSPWPLAWHLCVWLLVGACTEDGALDPSLVVLPQAIRVSTGETVKFEVQLKNLPNNPVVQWDILEGATGGLMKVDGTYVAPLEPGLFHVVASVRTSNLGTAAAPSFVTATATVEVYQGALEAPDTTPPARPEMKASVPASPANNNTPLIQGFAEPNSKVSLFKNSTCAAPAAAEGDATAQGTFSIPVTVADNTTTLFYAKATDAAGNASGCSFYFVSYTEDSVAPTTPMVSATVPVSPNNNNLPAVTGTADASAWVDIYDNSTCSGTRVGTGRADSLGRFVVAASVPDNSVTYLYAKSRDDAGNTSACSSTFIAFQEDSTPPGAPALLSVSPTPPANNNTPLLAGTAEPFALVRIYGNAECSGNANGQVMATNQGNFVITLSVPDNFDGGLYATATDASENTSTCSPLPLWYTEDSQNPVVTFVSPQSGSQVRTSSLANLTLQGTCSENGRSVTLTSPCFNTSTSCALQAWTKTFDATGLAACPSGFSLTAKQTDVAGNVGSSVLVLTVDDTPPPKPVVLSVSPASPANMNTPKVLGTTEASSWIKIFGNALCTGNPLGEGKATVSSTFEVTVQVANNSDNVFYATAMDGAGNVSECSTTYVAYTEDSTGPDAPTVVSISPDSPSNSNSPAVTGTATPSVTIKIFGTSDCTGIVWGTGTSNVSGNFSVTTLLPSNTTYTLYAMAFDSIGNPSTCSTTFVNYVEDSTVPAMPVVVSTNPTSPSASTTPFVEGTAEEGSTVKIYTNSNCSSPLKGNAIAAGGNFSAQVTVANDSSTQFYATATDLAGNTSACSATHVTYVQFSAPLPEPVVLSTTPPSPANNNAPSVVGTAQAGNTVKIYTDASCTSVVAASGVALDGNFSLLVSVQDNTSNTFYARAFNDVGNSSPCSSTYVGYVEDSTPPTVPIVSGTTPQSPSNNHQPTVLGTAEADSAIKIYTNATCTSAVVGTAVATGGNFSAAVTLSNNATTTLYATATDAAGNASSCSTSFVTFVEDSVAPNAPVLSSLANSGGSPAISGTAEANALITLYTTADCSGANVGTGSANNVGAFTVVASLAPNTQVTFYGTATDAAGNVSSCASSSLTTAIVTVSGTVWVPTSCAVASGGTRAMRGGHAVHTFTSSGTFSSTCNRSLEVLVVGGGGGGVLYNASYSATANTVYSVTVGAGGAGSAAFADSGSNGGNSIFGTLTAVGGGLGATGYTGLLAARTGGSGGGGDGSRNSAGAQGTFSQGYAGGSGVSGAGGGGGGANGAGTSATSGNSPGNGGEGYVSSINGVPTYYGGGGGGAPVDSTALAAGTGQGGLGGGGAGALGWGDFGAPNTGGGGGGGGYNGLVGAGGHGGSGVVVVRYVASQPGAAGSTVRIKINGQGDYTAQVDANGQYSLTAPLLLAAGNVLTVYLDGAAHQAVTYTRAASATANVTGLDLTSQTITLSHEDAGPFTNANVNVFDSAQDVDIGVASDGTDVTVGGGWRLQVAAGKTFAPGGTVTTAPSSDASSYGGDFEIGTSATLNAGANALSVGGDFINAGTFTYAPGQTLTFTATSAGHVIEDGQSNFYNLVFDGTGGTWRAGSLFDLAGGEITFVNGEVFMDGQ